MNTLFHDIRFAFRMLLKHKGFTAVALIALALGIGANSAIFSLVNGVLLRPLPYPDAERIVYFEGHNPTEGITDSNISVLDFQDWSARSTAFSSAAFFWSGGAALSPQGGDGSGTRSARRCLGSISSRCLGCNRCWAAPSSRKRMRRTPRRWRF